MPRARRRRDAVAIAVSAGLHLVLAAVLAVQAPRLRLPPESPASPPTIIPLLLVPRLPPSHAPRPEPLKLHQRLRRFETPPPIAPLPAPAAPASRPAPPGPVTLHPAPLPEGPKADLRAALRASPVGCANADAVGLNRAERAACDEQFGKGARTAAFPGLGLASDKQAAFDQAAARKDACRTYRAGGDPPRLRDGTC
jgi:hypothetical protein